MCAILFVKSALPMTTVTFCIADWLNIVSLSMECCFSNYTIMSFLKEAVKMSVSKHFQLISLTCTADYASTSASFIKHNWVANLVLRVVCVCVNPCVRVSSHNRTSHKTYEVISFICKLWTQMAWGNTNTVKRELKCVRVCVCMQAWMSCITSISRHILALSPSAPTVSQCRPFNWIPRI